MPRLRLSEEGRRRCEAIVARYPQRRAALVPVLLLARQEFGECSDAVTAFVADLLDLPLAQVAEVAASYPLLRVPRRAQHELCVCSGLSCRLSGSERVWQILADRLGVGEGEITGDGEYALGRCACTGACATAPVVALDGEIHASLTERLLEQLLERLGR